MSTNPYEAPTTVDDGEGTRPSRPARMLHRTLAAVIDLVIVPLVVVITSCPFVLLSGASFTESGMTFLDVKWLVALPIILLIVPLGYHTVFLARYSATPGKRLMNVMVVHGEHGRIGLGRAMTRYLASCVSAGCLGVGYLVAFFNKDGKTIHDFLAGTDVVVADAG